MAKDGNVNTGGHESKDAPDKAFADVPGSVARWEKGPAGADRVGNYVPNPFGPSKNSDD